MFNIGLRSASPFLTLQHSHWSMFVLQITYGMKYLVLLLFAIAPRIHPHVSSLVQHSHWSWSCYKPIPLIRSAWSLTFLNILKNFKISNMLNNLQGMCSIERTWTRSLHMIHENTYSVEPFVCWPCCTWSSSVHWVGFV